jgi:hypothetical protein
VIVLWKLVKPTGGGEPTGISLFYITGDFTMAASKRLCPRRIPKKRNQDAYGKQDLFAVVIAFRYLLTKEDFSNFKRKLVLEIGKLNKKFIYITETELLEQMGFPNNWKNIARYHTIL